MFRNYHPIRMATSFEVMTPALSTICFSLNDIQFYRMCTNINFLLINQPWHSIKNSIVIN